MKLSATFVKEGEHGFTGWVNEFSGVTAFGTTIEEATSELLKVLKVKFDAERKRASAKVSNTKDIIQKDLTVVF